MDSFETLIERCHQRHNQPLRQRKTVVVPAVYNLGYPFQYIIYCARNCPVLLNDVEGAGISFMPIGRAPENVHSPPPFAIDRFSERQGIRSWTMEHWDKSWGIQVYTGIPSEQEGARWHDLDFTYQAICAAPDAVYACIEALVNAVEKPLLTLTQLGGLRFSCRIPDYLHPNTEVEGSYIYKHTPTAENPDQTDVYLEILGERGYSCWDARYEILLGNLLDPPLITKEILFGPINALRAAIHQPAPTEVIKPKQPVSVVPPSLGSYKLDLAKKALLKRGFSYIRQENGIHYWAPDAHTGGNRSVSLCESDGTVWISASIPNTGLPTEATPITDVWEDIGILPSLSATGGGVSKNVLSIREGELSPLAIKRPTPILPPQPVGTGKIYGTPEENVRQIRDMFNRDVRIVKLITDKPLEKNNKIRSLLINDTPIWLNGSNDRWIEAAEQAKPQSGPAFDRWKPRTYKWEQVKDIPIEVRMANPFQHGNVCEDPERCEALEEKGGDPRESICPQCPVYTDCQRIGYLSQSVSLSRARVQISEIPKLFFNPRYTQVVKEILEGVNEGAESRLCIIESRQTGGLFLKCELPKSLLEQWCNSWEQKALGNFAKAILNALEISSRTHTDVVKRVRTVMQTFEWQAADIIRQMCHVNLRGIVVRRGAVDPKTGKELARFTIEFEGGTFAYIPVDDVAVDVFISNGLPFFQLRDFVPDEDMCISMPMTDAIGLGLLTVETLENIQHLPTVCQNPNWTIWHQLRHFFAHYTQDNYTPMGWDDEGLQFRVPPVLHPSIKRLLVISITDAERNFRRVFPNSNVEVVRTQSPTWHPDSQVFQIRTGLYRRAAMIDINEGWAVSGSSKTAQHFFFGIFAEIERTPNVKHGIITHRSLVDQLADVGERKNVCFVTYFRNLEGLETAVQEADVLWIVGTQEVGPGALWYRTQSLFGNDEKPLFYQKDQRTGNYKDERLQSVSEEEIFYVYTQIIGYAELDRSPGKKVVLISGTELPNITHRPETVLFDWADFEIAGGLDKLPEVIATRQRFEAEERELTAESSRKEVERILGCSSRQANRVLNKLRGGNIPRIPYREQIFAILADGEKGTAAFIEAIDGNPQAIRNELKHLVDTGKIVKVRWGVYALP